MDHRSPLLSDVEQLIAHLPVAVYVCEAPTGIILAYNRRAAGLWGREPRPGDSDERFCGSFRLFRPDGARLPHDETPMAEVLRDGLVREGEVVIERPDGSRLTAAVNVAPLRDPAGRIRGAVNVFQDVTGRKAAAEALSRTEARYRAIAEDQPDLVCRFLRDGTITFANEAYCRFFGVARDAVVGRTYVPFVHPDDVRHVEAALATLGPANPIVTIENRVRTADGTYRWTQWTNRALYDAGRSVEFQASGRDVTNRREAEETAARLAAIVTSAEDAIVSKTLDGKVTSWNRAAEAMFGYSSAEMIGRSITTIIPSERHGEEEDILRRLRNGEVLRHFETERVRKDGRRIPVSLTVSPVRNAAGEIIGASKISRDITDRRQAEIRLQELLIRERAARHDADTARAEAEQASRAKDEFLAMLAHELRNPLSVIANALVVLEARSESAPMAGRARRMIRKQTGHLTRLLDDLLDVARITSGRIELEEERIDLRSVAEAAVESQRHHFAKKRQRLEVSLPEEPVPVVGDPVRLQQVVGNLLNNASRYTPAGGAVEIVLTAAPDEAEIRVRDDGRGIASEDLEEIFDLFRQASPTLARTDGGLGIGLTLVRRVVHLHGGAVWASSAGPGRGAEFVVTLPLATTTTDGEEVVAGEEPPHPSRSHRILVIEDHDDGREMLAAALRLDGHVVHEAATGFGGIEAAERHAPEVVLVDIGLPDLDGYEVGRRIRGRLGGEVRLIAVTGYGQPADRVRSSEAGFDAHLIKPVDPSALAEALADSPGPA